MGINGLCGSPSRIRLYLDFLGSWGNANMQSLFDLIVTPFGSPTLIGGLLVVVCSWGSLFFGECRKI